MRYVIAVIVGVTCLGCQTLVESACRNARDTTPEKADECMAIRGYPPPDYAAKKKAAKERREREAAEEEKRLAEEAAAEEQAKRDRCVAEVKQYGGEFWQCMNFYEARERHEQDAEEREADRETAADVHRQEKADRDAAIWANGIRDMGDKLTPKTTTCTTRSNYMGGVETVCH